MIGEQQLQVVLAAGGNPTGVICYPDDRHRGRYGEEAKRHMAADPTIEQFGFLEGTTHLQMSGGEFCGNAARVAALLISEQTGRNEGTFTISGYDGTVRYVVNGNLVRGEFPRYRYQRRPVKFQQIEATLVDLGGIVHVVLPPTVPFRNDKAYYQHLHGQAVQALALQDRAAVGMIWVEFRDPAVAIHPVVWVREIDSFFYESSCGSGTLATIIALDRPSLKIYQPSGQAISAERYNSDTLAITSTITRR
ncbi:MAG: hypothetical protein HYY50_03210 [Candidatus Kerfeldbacteria bacterium]|nr:hypothetical protein [Candidatus Kerfeldbacteria bacterium]